MRLYEAIRRGSMIKPQGYDRLLVRIPLSVRLMGQKIIVGYSVRTCAIGAALDAVGQLPLNDPEDYEYTHPEEWNVVMGFEVCCPVPECAHSAQQVKFMIPHLNDDHAWTREAIAGWLEPIECAIPVSVVEKGALA